MITVWKLTNFWETLDMLTDMGMPAISWRGGHPGEWEVVGPLLVNTGRRAASVDCPSGAGEFCPRKVIELSGGRMIAECQDIPAVCDTLEVTLSDIQMQRVDRAKFAALICDTLNLTPAQQQPFLGGLFAIGSRDVVAGRRISVFGLFQGGSQPEKGLAVFDGLQGIAQPQLLLVPTSRTMSEDQKQFLARAGAEWRAFDDVLVVDGINSVSASPMISDLLRQLEDVVRQSLQGGPSGLVWALPADATWAEMTISLISDEVINLSFRGETRRYEPLHLAMVNDKTGKANLQWIFLVALAIAGGAAPMPAKAGGGRKHKEGLSRTLMAAFGIQQDPITAKNGQYHARFVIRDDRSEVAKRGGQRNFADDD